MIPVFYGYRKDMMTEALHGIPCPVPSHLARVVGTCVGPDGFDELCDQRTSFGTGPLGGWSRPSSPAWSDNLIFY